MGERLQLKATNPEAWGCGRGVNREVFTRNYLLAVSCSQTNLSSEGLMVSNIQSELHPQLNYVSAPDAATTIIIADLLDCGKNEISLSLLEMSTRVLCSSASS